MTGEGTAELTNQMITKTFQTLTSWLTINLCSVSVLTESGKTQQILYICMHMFTCMCVIVREKLIVCVFQAVKMVEAERRGIQIVTSPVHHPLQKNTTLLLQTWNALRRLGIKH